MTEWPFPLPVDDPDFQLDIFARTLWGEARSEGRKGMEAVAAVVMNRLTRPCWWSRNKSDGIPDDTIAAVCLDPWQFSCWNPKDPNRAKMLAVTDENAPFSLAKEIATLAMTGIIPDPTGGACHYKVRGLPWPKDWGAPRDEPDYICGNHEFYRGIK